MPLPDADTPRFMPVSIVGRLVKTTLTANLMNYAGVHMPTTAEAFLNEFIKILFNLL